MNTHHIISHQDDGSIGKNHDGTQRNPEHHVLEIAYGYNKYPYVVVHDKRREAHHFNTRPMVFSRELIVAMRHGLDMGYVRWGVTVQKTRYDIERMEKEHESPWMFLWIQSDDHMFCTLSKKAMLKIAKHCEVEIEIGDIPPRGDD